MRASRTGLGPPLRLRFSESRAGPPFLVFGEHRLQLVEIRAAEIEECGFVGSELADVGQIDFANGEARNGEGFVDEHFACGIGH